MGPSIEGLDKLLKMPTGCGEQNMVGFAATGQLNEKISQKAKIFMQSGMSLH